jgi:hypothetical protein
MSISEGRENVESARDNAETNGHKPTNYRDLAPVYLRRGYAAPIPLPQGRKSPPPRGFTGRSASPPTADQIEEWRETRGNDGIAFVLQEGEIVIDVDNYAKGDWPAGTGAATMADLAERAGCDLPRGPKLRNRTDGSEKRPFRVPKGLKFRKSLGACVDVVTPTHRYVNAGINPETGNPEQWFDADDKLLDEPPPPETWPELPEAWLPFVIQGCADDGEPASLATEEQAQAWLDGMPKGPMGCLVREEFDHALAGLNGRCPNPEHGARHDCMQEHVRWIVEYGAAGLTGVPAALKFLKAQYIEAVCPDRPGGARQAANEFDGYDTAFVQWGARVCRPDIFHTLQLLEHIGFDGWLQGVEEAAACSDGERVTRSLADVEPTKVTWLWPYWIPLGKVSILEGEPGEGKSLLTLAMTALVTIGGELPMTMVDGGMVPRSSFGPAGVVLVGVEDDEADTVVPRLDAAGADRTRVYVMNQPTDDNGNPKPFLIPEDVNRLQRAIGEVNAKVVFIDPVTAFLSTKHVKAGDDASTRQALMPLVMLAADAGCAIVLVRHLNKASGMSATHRGSGTIAFAGITRSVIVAGKLREPAPDGATHAIARTKGNLSKEPMAIGYQIDSAADDPDSPVVRWCSPMDLTADQLVGADGAKVSDARKNAPVRNECERVLAELLADGPMPVDEAIAKARRVVDCSAKTVRAAADRIGVVKKQVRVGGQIDHWTWELPPKKIRFEDLRDGGEEKLDSPDS